MNKLNSAKFAAIISFLVINSFQIFAQSDIPRQTTAVTYERDELIQVQFRGTTRFPRMNGNAKIKRTSRNGTEIDVAVSKMPRPFELGAGYATYVLWAISPDGQVDNLGEIKRKGFFEFDSKIRVTTPLQTFALIITAEPHFLVKRPSRAIMLENLNPVAVSGKPVPTIRAVQYFGNSSDYFNDAKTPEIAEVDYTKTPPTILQGKQALALAEYAGAQRDAAEELKSAQALLINAEDSWKAGRDPDAVEVIARQAISAAVKAEETALIRKEARDKRNEKQRQDGDIQRAEDKYADALQQIENLKFELAREQRSRELVERDSQNYDKQFKDVREENVKLRIEIEKLKGENEDLKAKFAKTEAERIEAEKQREAQRQQDDKRLQIQANMPILMQSLKPFGTVRQNDRGIVLTLPETYWTGIRVSSFAPASEAKVNGLASILANNPEYKLMIESHTDNKGTPDDLQILTQERSQAIADKLTSLGVDQGRIDAKGYGSKMPISANTTNVSRAKNRRIDLILVPNTN